MRNKKTHHILPTCTWSRGCRWLCRCRCWSCHWWWTVRRSQSSSWPPAWRSHSLHRQAKCSWISSFQIWSILKKNWCKAKMRHFKAFRKRFNTPYGSGNQRPGGRGCSSVVERLPWDLKGPWFKSRQLPSPGLGTLNQVPGLQSLRKTFVVINKGRKTSAHLHFYIFISSQAARKNLLRIPIAL